MNIFFEERRKQIFNQIKIDQILSTLKSNCSDEVNDYLLLHREFTRNQQLKVINSPLLNLYQEISKQLKITSNFESIFFKNLDSFPTCEKLKDVIFLSSDNKNVQ
jgi:hypothetical protein